MQQNNTIPTDDVSVDFAVREQHCCFHKTEKLNKENIHSYSYESTTTDFMIANKLNLLILTVLVIIQ